MPTPLASARTVADTLQAEVSDQRWATDMAVSLVRKCLQALDVGLRNLE
jgi:hypothetical protein